MKNRPFPLSPRRRPVRRRRGTARLFVIGAAVAASTFVSPHPAIAREGDAPAAAAQAPQTFQFDIAAGPLATAVATFEQLTGLDVVLANPDLGTLASPGVVGGLTPQDAMSRLLTGTQVRATFEGRTVRLTVGGLAESVQVSASIPTVSSPKYTTPLRDIAQTVALIPRAVMEEQGATTLTEALRNVPGITLQAGEGGGASSTAGDMFNMRGFNAANSLFVDNVRDDGLISRDVFNLEQVEVFMGPTGSDVGRGTAAGYVNMSTKTPHAVSQQNVMFGVGSAEQVRLSTDFNWAVPTVANGSWLSKAAFRLNTLWQDRGVPGRDEVEYNSKAIAPSVALGVGTETRVVAGAQIMRQDNLPDYGIPSAAWQDSLLAPTVVRAAQPVDQSNYYGSPEVDYDRADQDAYMFRVERDVNRSMTIRNQTRYNKTHREALISAITGVGSYSPATNLVTIARQANERENRIVSNQTSLVDRFSTGTLRHAGSAGVEYVCEAQFAPTLTGTGTRAPVDIYSPNPDDPVTGIALSRTLAESTGSTHTIGAYLFDTVELNQRWQVAGGLRWERYQTDFSSTAATGVVTDLEGSGTLVSGKASVLFRVNNEGNIYLSYGTTLTPPGAANFSLSAQANNANNPNVEPQRSANVELGSKWDVAGGRLSLTGSVFRTENKNVIFTVDAAAVPPIFNYDDGQLVKGVSLGALGRITDRWQVIANAGYLDTELQTQNAANDGRRLTLTPAFSTSLWTTVRVATPVTVAGGIRHTGSSFVNAANTIEIPAYQVVDGLIEYAVNSNLSLRANFYNLTDETYIRTVNNNGGRYLPGFSRSVMLTSQVRF